MLHRKPVLEFKNNKYIGLFQYVPRNAYLNNLLYIVPKKVNKSVQTEKDPIFAIGEKVVRANSHII